MRDPAAARCLCGLGRPGPVRALVVVEGQADLLEVVLAPGTGRGLAGLLDGGEEQADQDGDDGDHHQQFDERECTTGDGATVSGHE